MTMPDINDLVRIARLAQGRLRSLSHKTGSRVISQGAAFGDATHDTDIHADRVIGELIQKELQRFSPLAITIEGLGGTTRNGDNPFWVTVDPLDGSLDYASRRWPAGLPYTLCITVFRREPARFSDVIMALVMDYRNGDLWTYDCGATYCNGIPVKRAPSRPLDLGSMIVLGEMYYPSNRELLNKVFLGQKGWLRNPGSAAYEMALVAEGVAAAMICDRQKQHELGAGYALVKGAGGVVIDFDGNDIGSRPYDFVTQVPVILAGDPAIAQELVRRIKDISP